MADENPQVGVPAAERLLRAAGLPVTDENVFITVICQEKGIAFLKGEAKPLVRKLTSPRRETAEEKAAKAASGAYTVTIDGVPHRVVVENGRARIDSRDYTVEVREGIS
jgi:hypothetical protein